jgi:outer membrane protein OmpA-like peptidoglycan-associated protein
MTVKNLFCTLIFSALSAGLFAQTPGEISTGGGSTYRSFTPKDKWEVGLNLGLPFVTGDVDAKFPGFGGGLHVRKSLDHIFSLRGHVDFASAKNEGDGDDTRKSDLTWLGGGGQVVVALNNFKFNKPNRKILLNGFAGIGATNFTTNFENIQGVANGEISETSAYMDFGGGIAYRVNSKFNIGFEYTVMTLFGRRADLLDGDENTLLQRTTYRDNLHYPHLQLNFNIGGKSKDGGMAKVEPLYWNNPLGMVSDAISALEARPIYDPTDTDGDGIIDAIDDEDNSPAGARVDSKGVTLDSDGDKVADYKDKEPYSPPGFAVNGDGIAQGMPKYTTENDVNRIVDAKLANFKLPVQKGLSDWFLPIINFGDNRYDIRYSEYEKLYQVATVLKQNPDIKVVAAGHTDRRGGDRYNNVLSYNRAKAAIEFLVSQHGISRDRLILNWVGEGTPLVPVGGSSLSNRRVEFRVAKDETEMARPEGPEAGKGKFKGNKDAGY